MTTLPESFRLGIVGAGLIGGSIARTASRSLGTQCVVGVYDLDVNLQPAVEEAGWTWIGSLTEMALWADVMVMAVPLRFNGEVLSALERAIQLRSPAHRLTLTDVGSQKAGIAAAVAALPHLANHCEVVLGHPMAGTEHSGFTASFDGLFDGCTWVLCPDLDPSVEAFARVTKLVISLGARVSVLPSYLHDQVVAQVSHVPYALAAAEALLVAESETRLVALRLAAGSFSDLTRVAGSPSELSISLLSGNADAVVSELDRVIAILTRFRDATERDDQLELRQLFTVARSARATFLDLRGNLIRTEEVVPQSLLVSRLLEICQAGGLLHHLDGCDGNWRINFEPPPVTQWP